MTTKTRPAPSPALIESRRLHALAQSGDPRDYATARDALLAIAGNRISATVAEMAAKNGSWLDRDELTGLLLELALRQTHRYLHNPAPTAEFATYIFREQRETAIRAVKKELKHWRGRINDALREETLLTEATGCPRAEDHHADGSEIVSLFDRAGLKPQAREILIRHDGLGETHREMAEALGRPLNTVKSDYRRALARVRAVTA